MNTRQLRALRKDKVARKFAALADPVAPPVEFDEEVFLRADLAEPSAQELAERNDRRALLAQIAAQSRDEWRVQ